MKSYKLIEVFNYVKNNEEITLKEISEKFNISQRNIRYEIEKMNEYLLQNNYEKIEIEKGILKSSIWNKIIELLEVEDTYALSSEERKYSLILKTLLEREINQKKLAEELDVSLTTIKSHLKEIKSFLESYNIQLIIKPKKGLELIGEEESIRGALLKLINIVIKGNSKYLKEKIKESIFEKISDDGIKRFINYCQKLMGIIISDEAYQIISNYIKISLYMNSIGKKIISIKNEKFLSDTKEYKCIKKASSILEEYYEIELCEFEYLKMTDYFLGSNTYNLNYSYYDNWVEIEMVVKKMIMDFNNYIEEDILKDKILLEGLLNHIKPTIYRIKNKIELENSVYKEVIESYPNYFNITKSILEKLEYSMDIKFTDDEISFLVIHFKAAIDRNKIRNKKIKVILVCGLGYGTSKLLAQQLKQTYDIEIMDIIPKYLIEKQRGRADYDLVLSTVDIEDNIIDKPIIKLNTILTRDDQKKIEEFGIFKNSKKISLNSLMRIISESCKELDEKQLLLNLKDSFDEFLIDDIFHKKNTIFDYIKPERILLNEELVDWKDSIKKVGSILLKSNTIKESYIQNSIRAIEEFGTYMILAPGVLFPHARTEGDVNETGFSLMTLKKPIIMPTKEEVSVIIMFSSKNNEEHLETFMQLVELANEDSFLKDIKLLKKDYEFINILKKRFPL
ncbi:MAG: BglG family transcription antiterminator [Fusobacteriaceae bacterium]